MTAAVTMLGACVRVDTCTSILASAFIRAHVDMEIMRFTLAHQFAYFRDAECALWW